MKILILDDHSLFSHGLGKILKESFVDLDLLAFASIADLSNKKIDYNSIDLLISDIELPSEDIFVFLTYLKSSYPNLPILIVSMHNKLSVIKKCKDLGIEGYILKDDNQLIISGVEDVMSGKEYYSEKVLETLSILSIKEKLLTPKEEEIIVLLAKGINNHEIADKLFISYNTIKTHRKNINRKLGLNTATDIIKYYYENYVQ